MNKIILAEKPKACDKIKDTLHIDTVTAVGHLIELQPRTKGWNPPYFDLEWNVGKKKKEKELLQKIVNKFQSASEIYIATDYDGEGQLIAYNILNYAGIKPSSTKRMKFSSLEPDVIKKSYSNPIPFDEKFALSAEVRHKLDWYFGKNISKAITQHMKKHNPATLRKYFLTPCGRVKTPVLKYFVDREKEIKSHIAKKVWYLKIRGVYNNKYFEIRTLSFDSENEANIYARSLDTGIVHNKKTNVSTTETYPPNKDYIVKKCLKKGISADIADYILQNLYLDGYISYPRTISKQYLSHGINTKKYLQRISGAMPLAKDALDKNQQVREGTEKGPHPAIYPILPYYEDDMAGIVWKIIAESFVKSHLPPEEHKYITVELEINNDIVIFYNNIDLEIGDKFSIIYQINERTTSPPYRCNSGDIYDWMVESKLGTVDTRTQILLALMNMRNNYLFETNAGIYTTNKAIKVIEKIADAYPDIVNIELTKRFEQYIVDVKNGANVDKILAEGRKVVTDIVNKIGM